MASGLRKGRLALVRFDSPLPPSSPPPALQHSSVLCVGLYDGTVCVYDVRSKAMAPIYQSTVKTGKHTDPVWEVCWQARREGEGRGEKAVRFWR